MNGNDAIGIIRLVLLIIIIIGIITTFWSFNNAVNESLQYAKSLDLTKWSDSLVKMLLTGVTLIIAGIIGEILTFLANPRQRMY